MYVTLMLSIRYVYHYIMYDYTFVWVSGRAEKTQDETRAPYAHLVVVSFGGIRRNIQNNMVFIAAILIIAKILHAVALLLLLLL